MLWVQSYDVRCYRTGLLFVDSRLRDRRCFYPPEISVVVLHTVYVHTTDIVFQETPMMLTFFSDLLRLNVCFLYTIVTLCEPSHKQLL